MNRGNMLQDVQDRRCRAPDLSLLREWQGLVRLRLSTARERRDSPEGSVHYGRQESTEIIVRHYEYIESYNHKKYKKNEKTIFKA